MGKRIVILGHNGQLGSDLKKVLKGHELVNIGRDSYDILKDRIENLIAIIPEETDYVINCTSTTNVDRCEQYPDEAFRINSSFVYELTELCNKRDITLFHFSTDYVFDGGKKTPYREVDAVSPLNIYGISKASGEFAVINYGKKYFIFRVSSLFGIAGASGKGGNFIETMINLAEQGRTLKVISDQYMSPTNTLDVARAVAEFIESGLRDYGIYHCCNSGSCSWYEFARAIFDMTNKSADLMPTAYDTYEFEAKRPKYSVMNNAKISRYYKMPEWKEGLKEYLIEKGRMK